MRTGQCGRCLHYRGALTCDPFPRGIPEEILTGKVDHSEPYGSDRGVVFHPVPSEAVQKSLLQSEPLDYDHTKTVADRDDRAYQRVKAVLQNYGYSEEDFQEGGALYGYSVNQLIDLVREKRR